MGAYLANTFGESYSKAVQGINGWEDCNVQETLVESLKHKAVFYCAYAVEWSGSDNQTYLRNLGCALETAYGTKVFTTELWKNVRNLYQKAIDICVEGSKIPDKVFYTLLSFDHKQSNYRISLLKGNIEDCTWLLQKTAVRCNEQVHYTEQALHYAELAERTYPDNLVFTKYYAFALRDFLIWEMLCNGKTKNAFDYKKRYNDILSKLATLYRNRDQWDDFMKSLGEYGSIFDMVINN